MCTRPNTAHIRNNAALSNEVETQYYPLFLNPFFILSLLGVAISLYVTYSWYVEGICLPCAYEHAQSDNRFYVQIEEYYYSEIYGAPVPLLSLLVFIVVSIVGLCAWINRVSLKLLASAAGILLLPSLSYGLYLQYVALFILNTFYPTYTLLCINILILSFLSLGILFKTLKNTM